MIQKEADLLQARKAFLSDLINYTKRIERATSEKGKIYWFNKAERYITSMAPYIIEKNNQQRKYAI